MMTMTGAVNAVSQSGCDRAAASRSLAAADLTKRIRAGLQLSPVGPSFTNSHNARNNVSVIGRSRQTLQLRADRNRMSSASSLTIRSIPRTRTVACRNDPRSDGAHLADFRDVVTQHVLDARLQGRGRTRAAGTGALHVQV